MPQPLHLTMEGTNPLTMSEWLWISTLISDMEGTKSFSHEQNGIALTSDLLVRMAQSQHSYVTWKELNPLTMTEWLSPYI